VGAQKRCEWPKHHQHTLLDARHFSDCAARSRGPSMAGLSSKHCRHYSATTQSKPTAKHALPNTAISAQYSLSPRTATRPNHVLGASRPLLLKSLLLASPASSLFLPVCTAVPHSVLAYEPFLPVKPDSSPAQARMYRRHLPRRTRGTG
jgi:hypothetical protein